MKHANVIAQLTASAEVNERLAAIAQADADAVKITDDEGAIATRESRLNDAAALNQAASELRLAIADLESFA